MGATSSLPAADKVETPLGFALKVVEQISEDVAFVSQEKGIKSFSNSLRAELFNISEVLCELDESSYNEQMKTDILAVLFSLESLCQWPQILDDQQHDHTTFTPSWYPGLSQLLVQSTPVQDSIRKVAKDTTARGFRRQILKSLAALGSSDRDFSSPGVLELSSNTIQTQDPPDNHSHLQRLHTVVSSFCICRCEQDADGIVTNLRLNWSCNEEHDADSHVPFGLLFLDHHKLALLPGSCRWQDVRISVRSNRQRKVKFDEDLRPLADEGTLTTIQALNDEFCAFITRGMQAQLHFEASEHGLKYQSAAQPPTSFLTNAESIPLTSLIVSRQLTAKMKALLSFFIARSVWQFYDSDWMKSSWSKDCVHFMGEHHRPLTDVVFINEPFLRTKVCETIDDHDDHTTSHNFTTHLYPKILALGVMLLEIELGKPIQELSRPDAGDLDEVNALHWAACDILRDQTIWPPEDVFTDVREIIRICIEPDLEKLGLAPSTALLENKSQVRSQLYKSVVGVLQEFVKKAWGDPDKIKINPIEPRSKNDKANVKKDSLPSGLGSNTFTNHERIMTQIGQQHVTGDIHYHIASAEK